MQQHDVYFGDDEVAVANATIETLGIYRGRQAGMLAYKLGVLDWGKTYYWRIDEVNQADPNSLWKGDVWSFRITDFIVAPDPLDGALDVIQPVVLRWRHEGWRQEGPGVQYDVYFGDDKAAVANATTGTLGTYRGRQPAEEPTCDAGVLEWGKTYYWRIDGADLGRVWKGCVESFTTADFIVAVVDDLEGYTDDRGHLIFKTWIARGDAWVGNTDPGEGPPYAEQRIVHGGKQSMPMAYDNTADPWYSEAQRTWEMPQDWTRNGPDALTLYFRGQADNSRDRLYAAIEDSAGRTAVVTHPDPNAVLSTQWQKWDIALADVRAAGLDVAVVKKMVIGVGDRGSPESGGTGKIYIDDIRLTRRRP
jgi:hypothetical protein